MAARNLKTFASVFLSSIVLLTLGACSKCGGNTEVDKQSYIVAQDAICAQITPTAEEVRKQASQFRPDMPDNDRLQLSATVADLIATYNQQLFDALTKSPQPKEDAAIVQELFATLKVKVEKMQATAAQAKKLHELVRKMGETEGPDADLGLAEQIVTTTQEMKRLETDTAALAQKQAELSKKYGFKSCFQSKQ